jgi:DNA-binding NarL/FixJ family response regulator
MRVVIAEDSVLLREGLVQLLARFDMPVLAAVGDGTALVAAVAAEVPDLVVTDVRMPPGFTDEGLRAAVRLRAAHPGLPVLALSQYVQHTYAAELLASQDGRESATCSRTGSAISRSSSDRCAGWRPVARLSTRRSYAS